MIRDVFNAVIQATLSNMPTPGLSAVTPSQGSTGTVTLDGVALGTFYGLLQILSTGPAGTATAQLSLNAASLLTPTFQTVFTIPSEFYAIPLEQMGSAPGIPIFSLPSGLQLGFSGTFTQGDSYAFTASVAPDFRVGEEHLAEQDRIFPSVILIPSNESFVGTEDYAGTKNYINAPLAVAMGENAFEVHCWGIDYDRTELLKNQVIYGIRAGVSSPSRIFGGSWTRDGNAQNKAGREYVLQFASKIPVVELDARSTTALAPTHLANISTSPSN